MKKSAQKERTCGRVAVVEQLETRRMLTADPSFGQQWALHNTGQDRGKVDADIDAPEAWGVTTGSPQVVVFVVDTGVDYTHPDLAANIWTNPGEVPGNGIDDDGNGYVDDVHGWDAYADDGDPREVGHGSGTHMAGIIGAAANNGIGVAGVNWDVKIGAVKVLSDDGTLGNNAQVIKALEYLNTLKQQGVNVVAAVHGYGGANPGERVRELLAGPAGMDPILHVARSGEFEGSQSGSAGFSNDDTVNRMPFYPASYGVDNMVSVAPSDRKDAVPAWANWGATSVDLAAPGIEVLSTALNHGYALASSGNAAAAHVAGAAALIAARHPGMTAETIKAALMDGTDYIGGVGSNASRPTATNGRLNAYRSLLGLEKADLAAPAPVANLAVSSAGLVRATLSWTATGDDGLAGTARTYDVRFSTAPITDEATWAAARPAAAEPRPAAAGSQQILQLGGLSEGTTYYFAMKVRDSAGNESSVSNVVAATTAVGATVFSDGFEAGLANWAAQPSWARTTAVKNSGNYGVTDSPSGNYANNANSALTSATINLAGQADPYLAFWHHRDLQRRYDWGRVKASGDNGATWTRLASYTGAPTPDAGYTGGDQQVVLDLSALAGNPFVKVRFVLQSDAGVTRDGWYIDDVKIVARPDTTVPVAPTGLVATALSNRRVGLNWVDQSGNEAGFHVWYRRDGGAWELLATTGANASTFTTASLARGKWYFRVSAFSPAGESGDSNVAEVTL